MTDISSELANELKAAVKKYAEAKKRFMDSQAASQEAFNTLVRAEADMQPLFDKLERELDK